MALIYFAMQITALSLYLIYPPAAIPAALASVYLSYLWTYYERRRFLEEYGCRQDRFIRKQGELIEAGENAMRVVATGRWNDAKVQFRDDVKRITACQ